MQTDDGGPLGAIFDGRTMLGLDSAELLHHFAARRDEAAFAALVDRHGPMVLATCRRVLANPADADDAFQATFLVLARKAGAIGDPDRLAPWLHGVARRVASKARSNLVRREIRAAGQADANLDDIVVDPPPADSFEVRGVIDAELARLPAKYREALVLCYLEGLTHDEAASQLACPVGTVRSRLAGGRDRLRDRLTRRGFAPGTLAVLSPATLPSAVVSRPLLAATVRLVFMNGSKVATSAAVVLAQGVLTSMFYAKIQTAAAITLAVAATFAVGTVGVVARQQPAVEKTANPPITSPPQQQPAIEKAAGRQVTEYPKARGDATYAADSSPPARNFEEAVARIKVLERELAAIRETLPPPLLARKDSFEPTKVASGTQLPRVDFFGGSAVVPVPESGKVVVAPPDRKQITVIDTATGSRSVYRPPGSVTRISPVVGQNMIGLQFEGDKVTQLAAYSPRGTKWVTQDLVEPAPGSAIKSIVGRDLAQYLVGRHLYLFGAQANAWAVAELQDPEARERWGQMGSARSNGECIVIADGDRIHTYNFRTGVLEQTSLKADPNQPEPSDEPASPTPLNPPGPQNTDPRVLPVGKDKLMIIPPEHDRVIVSDLSTGTKATFRLSGQFTAVTPLVAANVVGLDLKGPRIPQAVAYSIPDDEWITQDLRAPVLNGSVSPQVGPGTVEYRVGRSIYHFSQTTKKWTVIDFKQPLPDRGGLPTGSFQSFGSLFIPDGDILHIYTYATGVWSTTSIKNDNP